MKHEIVGNFQSVLDIIEYLRADGIDPILYGSRGVALYLGEFKELGDIDLLVEGRWVQEQWPNLVKLMRQKGFKLLDKHEHEFENSQSLKVGFADEGVLARDGVIESGNDMVSLEIENTSLKTLTPQAFLRAYEFSAKDGYRKDKRDKNDIAVIHLLEEYTKANKQS